MVRRTPSATRTYKHFPYTTLCRSPFVVVVQIGLRRPLGGMTSYYISECEVVHGTRPFLRIDATITEMGDGRAAFAERASARSLSGRHIGKTPTGRPRDAPMHFRQRRLVGADQRPLAQARVQRSLDSRQLGVVFFLKCTDGQIVEIFDGLFLFRLDLLGQQDPEQIGRASWRERVGQYV